MSSIYQHYRQVQIKCSSQLFLQKFCLLFFSQLILSPMPFYQLNSLVYSHSSYNVPTNFQSKLELAWFKTVFINSYLGFFLSFTPGSRQLQNWASIINFPQLVNLFFFPFLIHNIVFAFLMTMFTVNNGLYHKLRLISFSAHIPRFLIS